MRVIREPLSANRAWNVQVTSLFDALATKLMVYLSRSSLMVLTGYVFMFTLTERDCPRSGQPKHTPS